MHAVAVGVGYSAMWRARRPQQLTALVRRAPLGDKFAWGRKGFDTKAVRTIIRLRKKDQAERQEEEAILDLYKAALGME
ncbi:MAG: GapR family DNA-binding domain-containing protein [Pseudaminobacter sp.]